MERIKGQLSLKYQINAKAEIKAKNARFTRSKYWRIGRGGQIPFSRGRREILFSNRIQIPLLRVFDETRFAKRFAKRISLFRKTREVSLVSQNGSFWRMYFAKQRNSEKKHTSRRWERGPLRRQRVTSKVKGHRRAKKRSVEVADGRRGGRWP